MKQSYIVELIIAGQNTAVRVYQVIPLATKRFCLFHKSSAVVFRPQNTFKPSS